MASVNEFVMLRLKLESLSERIEFKHDELSALIKEYKATYPKYVEMAVNVYGEESVAKAMKKDKPKSRSCSSCKYVNLSGDANPCFTCEKYSKWKDGK